MKLFKSLPWRSRQDSSEPRRRTSTRDRSLDAAIALRRLAKRILDDVASEAEQERMIEREQSTFDAIQPDFPSSDEFVRNFGPSAQSLPDRKQEQVINAEPQYQCSSSLLSPSPNDSTLIKKLPLPAPTMPSMSLLQYRRRERALKTAGGKEREVLLERRRQEQASKAALAAGGRKQVESFVPRYGIDREVISPYICMFLGDDALCRPGNYTVRCLPAFISHLLKSRNIGSNHRTKSTGILHHCYS